MMLFHVRRRTSLHRRPARGRAARSVALLLALPALAPAQITPEHVANLDAVTSVAMSPDGRWVAYTVSHPRGDDEEVGRARSGLWLVAASGGEPRAIVPRPGTATSPAWSPDGATLAFIARLEGHELPQVYGVAPAGGAPRLLTSSPSGVTGFAFSPDGRRIAYTTREPEEPAEADRRRRGYDQVVASRPGRHARLWVENAGGGGRQAVTPANRTVHDFAWSPDGRTFAVQTTEGTGIDDDMMFRQLQVVQTDGGGEPRVLVPTQGKLGPMAWSPDGEQLAFLGAVAMNDPLAQSVFVVRRSGGEARNLTPDLDASGVWVGWQDARTILFIAVEGTRTSLFRVPSAGGASARVLGRGAEVFQSASFDRQRQSFATAAHSAQHPAEVYVGAVRGGPLRRVTRHNAFLAGLRLARQETIEWRGRGGLRIEGVLTYPLNAREGARAPLIVLPHGGPEGISFDGWTTRALYPVQVLAARGYAVLEPNYRASGGRGVEFAMADHRDLGGWEFDDVVRGIDLLHERGIADSARVGISGTSYGGYFSAWAATRHTERFRAAATFAGISNWISFFGTTDIPHEMSLVHWDVYWWESPGLQWDRSPLAWIHQARTPTLVAHGLADERVHPTQSMELYQTMRLKGIPTEMVMYPREPHGLTERAHQLDFMQRLVEWMDRYVRGEEVVP